MRGTHDIDLQVANLHLACEILRLLSGCRRGVTFNTRLHLAHGWCARWHRLGRLSIHDRHTI
jgi:hypothetical protein